jgi:hypothetical protein
MDKELIIKQRDALLESHGLESRKLGEMLDKERQAHRNTKHQFDTFQKTHQHLTRTVSTQESRIGELENSKMQDKKRVAQLEATLKEQLAERNNLLLVLWTRLASLCGSDWAHDNSLINGRALPSVESVGSMLPGFSKNLMAAVKMIESIIGGFQGRIKGVERDLWREYQTLESHLDMRTKKLDRLEALVRSGLASGSLGAGEAAARLYRLEDAYRQLKVENHTLRTAAEIRARQAAAASSSDLGDDNASAVISPSPAVPTGPTRSGSSTRIPKSATVTTVTRTTSSASSHLRTEKLGPDQDDLDNLAQAVASGSNSSLRREDSSASGGSMDNKWMLRLRDLEYKLKAEREARVMDRGEALRRIKASENENATLRDNLEKEKKRQGR